MKTYKLEKLNEMYAKAEQVDAEIFSEMRSNLLLISGEHYNKRNSNFFQRVRDTKSLTDQQKIRLTKNHTQKIQKDYANKILSLAPGVQFSPKNENELQDQKSAELHQAIWADAKERYDFEEKSDEWSDDFTSLGEVAVKIFYDPQGGKLKGYEQVIGEDGQPTLGSPVYSGGFEFERIFAFNLLRDPDAKDLKKSPYLIVRKMVNKDILKEKYPELASQIDSTEDKTMLLFDGSKSSYRKSENETMVMELYIRPNFQHPNGYYCVFIDSAKLEEGELPGGLFPIVTEKFDSIQTTARGIAPVRTMRPYQVEINRSASKMAEHQITLGDDKLLIQNGTKISQGIALPGVRSINFTGMTPEILEGRDGSQYLNYMNSQIEELYSVMGVQEQEEQQGAIDSYALLFRSAKQKVKFQRYVRRFERFLRNVAKLYTQLAKIHLPEDEIIYAVGRPEAVNISEFKNSLDICYQIKLEPQTEDIESKLGRQLVISQTLQYTAAQLDKEDIGKLIRAMPYANQEGAFSDLTLDYDSATNDILALDRGELPPVHEYDNHVYVLKRLVARMRQADFKFLDPGIQQNYAMKVRAHEDAEAERLQKIKQAQSELIPTGGYMVSCDFYVQPTDDPNKAPKRVRIPSQALEWLIENLKSQGQSLEQLENANQGMVAQIAERFLGKNAVEAANGMAATAMGDVMPEGQANGSQQSSATRGIY